MDYTGYGDAPNDDLSLRQAWANMLRGLSNKQSWQDLGQGIQNTAQVLPNVAESLARGGAAQAVGTFGDLRDLKNTIQSYLPQSVQNLQAGMETLSNPIAKALVQRSPTTDQVLEAVPRATAPYEGYKQHEFIGQFVAPPATGLVSDVLKLGKNLPVGASIKAVDELPVPKVTKDELGFYSTLDDAVNNLKQEKGTNAQFLAQLLKSPSVKQEEIAVRGLDKFLENNPKLTKQEIQDYLLHNKSKLNETVLDENAYKSGTYEDYRLNDGEAIDDIEYINNRADDIHYEMKDDPASIEDIRNELLAKDPEKYADWETHPTNAEKLENDIDNRMRELAQEEATAEYWNDPVYRHEDEFGFEVLGNDNLGYSIKNPRGTWLQKSFNDLSDAEHYLRDVHLENGDLHFEQQGPKYADYQLDGPKENYREVLIQLPESEPKAKNVDEAFDMWMADAKAGKRGQYSPEELASITKNDVLDILKEEYLTPKRSDEFRSSHFDEPNILAHMRVNDRVIDGKKTLFIEEIQSDWHQAGRKKGYADENAFEIKKTDNGYGVYDRKNDNLVSEHLTEEKANSALKDRLRSQVPDAPYKKNWQEMAMRRAMQMAAEGGYDRIAFTTGAQQADRYNLSKQVNSIDWNPYESRGANKLVTIVPKNGNRIELPLDKDGKVIESIGGQFAGKPIDEVIGKEVAKKIMESQYGDLSGEGLAIGGEGMKGFYDKILPDYVNKYGKKYGIKVGKTTLQDAKPKITQEFYKGKPAGYVVNTPNDIQRFKTKEKAQAYIDSLKSEEVHYFDLTPEAKSSLLEKGSPLFAAPAIGLTGEESRREILEKLMGK